MSFGPSDNWKANIGKCDDSNQNSSAPDKIADYATWNVGVMMLEAGTWYDNIQIVFYSQYPEASN